MYFKTQTLDALTAKHQGKTLADVGTRPKLPFGLFEEPQNTSLETLIKGVNSIDLDRPLDDEVKAHVQHVIAVKLTKDGVSRLAECPNIRKIEYKDEKSATLPKEVTSVPTLEVLQLHHNKKFKALHKNLTLAAQLRALKITQLQNLQDISAIKALQDLTYLELYNTTKLKDYEPLLALEKLEHLRLESISLDTCQDTLTKLRPLHSLELANCCYMEEDQSLLYAIIDAHKDTLKSLGVQSCKLFNKPLPPMPHLQELDMDGASLLHADTFAQMPSLLALDLHYFDAETLPSSLEALSKLELLKLSSARALTVEGAKVLGQLQNLKYLDLSRTSLAALPDNLQNLKHLEALDLSEASELQDLSVLEKMTSLKYLIVGSFKQQQQIEKIVLGLPNLEEVVVSPEIDIQPLAQSPSLKRVSLGYGSYTQEQVGPNFTPYYSTAFRNP